MYFSRASPQQVVALDTLGTPTLLHFSINLRSGFSNCSVTSISWEICRICCCILILTIFLDCSIAELDSSLTSSDIRVVVLHTPETVSSNFYPMDLMEPLMLCISLFSSKMESFNPLTSSRMVCSSSLVLKLELGLIGVDWSA